MVEVYRALLYTIKFIFIHTLFVFCNTLQTNKYVKKIINGQKSINLGNRHIEFK